MTIHPEQDWSDYTCPHCGENIWDTDSSIANSYVEDNWYVQEITCGCGAEVRYSSRINDYPSYVEWNDAYCESNEEQETESDIVSRPPVDNSPIGQSRAVITRLHANIAATRVQRDTLIQMTDSFTPSSRNSNRMSPELIQQWRQNEKRRLYLEFEEKIEALCQDLQREQAILDRLEQEEVERLAQEAVPPIRITKDLATVFINLMADTSRQ